jgi:hypothetical protein
MTDTKPEALRLADELLFAGRFAYETEDGAARRRIARNFKAAAELRRLHEVNAELLEALKSVIRDGIDITCGDITLVAPHVKNIKAAIAKARESNEKD